MLAAAGHISKIHTLAYAPLLLAGVVLTFRQNRWLGAAITRITSYNVCYTKLLRLIEKITNFTFGFFVGLVVMRYLGPARFGELSYAISITGILSFFAVLGLDSIVVRELVKFPEKTYTILGTTFALKLIGSVALVISAVVGEYFLGGDGRSIKFILVIGLGYVFDAFRVVDFYFQAQKSLKYPAMARVFGDILFSIFRIYLVYINAEIQFFVFLQGAYMAFYGLFFYLINRKHGISRNNFV